MNGSQIPLSCIPAENGWFDPQWIPEAWWLNLTTTYPLIQWSLTNSKHHFPLSHEVLLTCSWNPQWITGKNHGFPQWIPLKSIHFNVANFLSLTRQVWTFLCRYASSASPPAFWCRGSQKPCCCWCYVDVESASCYQWCFFILQTFDLRIPMIS